MKIFEFNIPFMLSPSHPYWIKELKIVFVPTLAIVPASDYYGPKYLTKVILYDYEPQAIKQVIFDIISFSNFLNQNYASYLWMYERSFSDSSKYEKNIDEINDYVNAISEIQDWHLSLDFDNYPLLEISSNPTEICFSEYFNKYINLSLKKSTESQIKQLIDFFSYSYITSRISSRIYSNSNLEISNAFIIIEALINLDIKDQTGYEICPLCLGRIPKKRKMTELIEEYIRGKTDKSEVQNILISILKVHYKSRNLFFHNAKYDTTYEQTNRMIEKLGKNDFSLFDEINHAGASSTCLFIINSFIRIELLSKLDKT